jgi:DNA-binding response OmpR family regulator
MKSILLVDDEADSASALQQTLSRFGYHVDVAHTTEAALCMVEKTPFDLVLLDLNVKSERSEHPDVAHGTGLVRQLRASRFGPPILTFTFLDGALYETASLDAGADDFILKTTEIPRLLSRLNMHIRRYERDLGKKPTTGRRIGFGRFTLDRDELLLSIDDTAVELSPREARIIEVMAANPARIVPVRELLDHAWGQDIQRSPSALEGAIKRLRYKLQKQGITTFIENVKGRGFRLSVST